MYKNEDIYNLWNDNKKNISKNNSLIKFQQFQIIFMKVGINIGFEQDGKGEDFLRPVLVYKKFNNRVFLVSETIKIIKNNFNSLCLFGNKFYFKIFKTSFSDVSSSSFEIPFSKAPSLTLCSAIFVIVPSFCNLYIKYLF